MPDTVRSTGVCISFNSQQMMREGVVIISNLEMGKPTPEVPQVAWLRVFVLQQGHVETGMTTGK